MSSFTDFDPTTSVIKNEYASSIFGKEYRVVTKPFIYQVGDLKSNVYIAIARGYITDGASVPSFLNPLLPAWGEYGAAAIVHDYLCEHLTVVSFGQEKRITRRQADDIFYEAMGVLKVPTWKRRLFWLAVRLWAVTTNTTEPKFSMKKQKTQAELANYFNANGNYNYGITK